MDIKSDFGLKRPKESFSFSEKTDVPLYKRGTSYNNYKEMIPDSMKGVKGSEKNIINKSDYTQRGEK